MSEKYSIEELIVRFLQQDINEDELRYLKSWLEEDVEHKSYFFELKGISDSSRRSFFSKEGHPFCEKPSYKIPGRINSQIVNYLPHLLRNLLI